MQGVQDAAVLPVGFRVRLAGGTRRTVGGGALVGGSPLTVMRLTDRAASTFTGDGIEVRDRAGALVAERLLATNLAEPVLDASHAVGADQLTVVVPVRDRPAELGRALAALEGLSVVVVDDASHDAEAVAAVARRHGADLIRLPRNLGPAGARNKGLATVRTPYVAFVDSDVTVDAATLLGLSAHFADPRVALVAPYVGARLRGSRRWYQRYEEGSPSLGLGERAGSVRPGTAVAWVPSACVVARTERLGAGFDPGLRVGEDVDLVWRLADADQRVRYDPAYVAHHDVRPTLRGWLGRKFTYGTGGAALASRHPDHVVTAVLSPLPALAGAAVLVRSRWAPLLAIVAVLSGAREVRRRIDVDPGSDRLALGLATKGLGWTLRQESALVLRHWWPAALVGAAASPTGRRLVAGAIVVDVVATRLEHPELPVLRTLAGRRLDDLAYGAGLWWGALRAGSPRCLRSRLVLPRR
ncbi:mycofactocin biosynthesis glycosyltransferase MftF [Nocardioides agariphilus]|uniref:Mycofactocin biosynthesis glycosyltransferase MftF n=1 Tax=Nocardioides agariphilus TaxID=433664 RepID=A0A930VKD0_9ACTN|nr:mycofactocin biosynthesis glycosyltransferase MftF [Nocardioides agariphilus]